MADKSYLKDLIKKAKESKKEVEDEGSAFDFKPEDKKAMKLAEKSLAQAVSSKPAAGKNVATKTLGSPTIPSQTETEKTEFEKKLEEAEKKQIAQYGDVTIFKLKDNPLLLYYIPVPRPTAQEKQIINTIKEAATRLITISPYRIRDLEQRRNVYYQRVLDILRASPELGIPERRFSFYADAVVREMVGYGLIDQLVRDDQLEEIMIIGPQKPVYVFHRSYEMMLTNIEFYNDGEVEDLINKIAREIGRRVDISAPLLDARLPDGSRVNATIAPASVSGATLTIRKFRADPYSLVDLINYNTVNTEAAAFLWVMAEGLGVKPANTLISGGTGSGKTTLLNVMASLIPAQERIISIEDTAELSLPLQHWIRLESRPPGMEGRGEITLDVLTKNSLRMRPDRVIVGEVRHDEAFTLFTAMNTGHEGSFGTIHANSAQETIVRVISPPMNVPQLMLAGLDFIIIEHRLHDRKKGTIRRVTEIAEVTGVLEGKPQTTAIFERDPVKDVLERTSASSKYLNALMQFTGLSKKQLEDIIDGRQKFLQELVKKNARSTAEVAKACQDYLNSKSE